MINTHSIEDAMTRLSAVLRKAAQVRWADLIDSIRQELAEDPDQAISRTLRLYGGAGSLNDVVLYRDGQPLFQENQELDALRTRLFDLIHGR